MADLTRWVYPVFARVTFGSGNCILPKHYDGARTNHNPFYYLKAQLLCAGILAQPPLEGMAVAESRLCDETAVVSSSTDCLDEFDNSLLIISNPTSG
ncbi:hypothetical protein P5673_022824 [Acropora cervicornis]|uniref:Uncharacterized protein n=1 Tax=Acropora cervicornis TaxID=6130 RepID=A0AAD9Q6X5_ACRCE|nr:hypothetical protein P5673_022824 [Acropora cervicornis]